MSSIKFKIIPTNHVVIDVHVNGVPARMLVDTGAQRTAVTQDRVELYYDHFADKETYELKGAGVQFCGKSDILLKIIDEIQVNALVMDLNHINQAFAQYDQQPIDGIIGADILTAHNAVIDYKSQTITLNE